MAKLVEIEGTGVTLEFPDDTPDEVISETIRREFPEQSLAQRAFPAIRGTVTGLLTVGGAFLGAGAGPLGSVVGSGLGFSAGEQVSQKIGEAIGAVEPQTLGERFITAGGDIITGATAEAGGQAGVRAVGGILGKLLAPAKGSVTQEALATERLIKSVVPDAPGLSPAQKTDSFVVDIMEGISEASFTGGGRFLKFRAAQVKSIEEFTERVTESMASQLRGRLTPSEAGELVSSVIRGGSRAFKQTANKLYGEVDRLTTGAVVDLRGLKGFAKNAEKIASQRKGIGATQAGDALLTKVAKLDDVVPFEVAQSIRSGLLDEIGTLSISRDKARGLAKQLLKQTDRAMEDGAKNLNPEAKDAWRSANKFWRTQKNRFENKFIRKLQGVIEDNPEKIIERVFTRNNESNISRLWDVVGQDTKRVLKTAYLDDIVIKSRSLDDGRLLGPSFLGQLRRIGDSSLSKIYSPEELKLVRGVGKAAKLAAQRPKEGGGMAIQLTQFAVIGSVVLGRAEGIPILVAPNIISRIMIHPQGGKWLAEGLNTRLITPRGKQLAASLAGLASIFTNEALREQNEKQALPEPQPELGGA